MAVYSVKDSGSLSMNKSDDLCIHFLESLYDCAQSELLPVCIDAYPYNDKDIVRYEAIITNRDTEEEIADYLVSVYREGAEKASKAAYKTLRKVYKKVGFVAR